jgi:2-iminobutanoate/2-iminopropanoate deaminase
MLKTILSIVVALALGANLTIGADKKVVLPLGAKPGGSYSPGILVDGTLYISGQGGEDSSGKIPGDFESEMKQALDNVSAILREAGMSPADVVSVQIYLTNVEMFEWMSAVYIKYFKDPRPTRTTVAVANLVGRRHIEITVTARK